MYRVQCGGKGWSGATCCTSGNSCVYQNDWYSQCLPGAQVTTTSTKASTTSTTSTSKTSTTSTTKVTSTTTTSTTKAGTTTTTTSTTKAGTTTTTVATTSITGGASATASYSGNPFAGVQLWANDYYASEVSSLAIPSLSAALATKAAAVAKVPSFQWLDRNVTIDTLLVKTLSQIRAANNAGASPAYAGT